MKKSGGFKEQAMQLRKSFDNPEVPPVTGLIIIESESVVGEKKGK